MKTKLTLFENHITIKKIHETFPNIIPENFHFKEVSKDDVRKEMRNLNVKKSLTYGSVPASILILSCIMLKNSQTYFENIAV